MNRRHISAQEEFVSSHPRTHVFSMVIYTLTASPGRIRSMKKGGQQFRSTSSCAACKFLKRRCTPNCIFAPHFRSHELHKFAMVHKVFGASNLSKLLNDVPLEQREDTVNSLVYEAESRLHDPVYGCIRPLALLHGKMIQLQHDLAVSRARLASYSANANSDTSSNSNGNPVPAAAPALSTFNNNNNNNYVDLVMPLSDDFIISDNDGMNCNNTSTTTTTITNGSTSYANYYYSSLEWHHPQYGSSSYAPLSTSFPPQ